jgi:hypothetical protein
MNLANIFSQIGLTTQMSQDVTLLFAVIFVSFIFGMFIGRYKLVSILINIYISLTLTRAIPEKLFSDFLYSLIFFFVCVIIFTLVGKKLFEIHVSGMGSSYLWKVFVLSFFEVVLLISITLTMIPKKLALEYVSASSFEYLASSNWQFFWLIAPLVFVFFIQKKFSR